MKISLLTGAAESLLENRPLRRKIIGELKQDQYTFSMTILEPQIKPVISHLLIFSEHCSPITDH